MKKDWEIKKLGEVCEIIGGTTPSTANKSYWNGNEKWITPAEIDVNKKYIYDSVRHITKQAVRDCGLQLQPKGTVIFTSRAPIGKVAISEMEFYCNQGFKNFICSKRILNEYLYYFLLGNVDYLNSIGKGTTFKEISKTVVSQVEIPIPPLAEQKRIVKILDEKFAQLETIKANAQINLQNAKDLFQSKLTKAFSNTTWEKKRLSEISENLDSKRIPITKNVRKAGKYPYYGASGIVDYVEDYIFDGKFLLVSEDGANLLARTYPIAFIAEGKFWVNNHAHILGFKDEITMKFVELFFSNLDISPFVTGMAQPKFNQASLNNIEIPIPPLPEQKRIVKELDTLGGKVRQLQKIYTKQIANCEELKQALLKKAFEGEL